MRPPTNHPKVNVLMLYSAGAGVLAFSLATMAPGWWRLLAVLPGLLCVALLVSSFRAAVAAEKG